MSRKLENVLTNSINERLVIRNKILLNKNIFVNSAFIFNKDEGGTYLLIGGVYKLGVEYVCEFEAIDDIFADDFIIINYKKLTFF